MANNDLEKFLAGSGLNRVWEKVFSLVKILTGDVDVSTKGTLQKRWMMSERLPMAGSRERYLQPQMT